MATRKIKRFFEGGLSEKDMAELEADSADKAAGLAASNKDENNAGPLRTLIDRLRMGNIDNPESEAYKRLGAGRGRASRIPVEDRVGTPVEEIRARDKSAPVAGSSSSAGSSSTPATISETMKDAAVSQGRRQPSGDAAVAEGYSGVAPVKAGGGGGGGGGGGAAPVKKPVVNAAPAKAPVDAAPAKAPVGAAAGAPKVGPVADPADQTAATAQRTGVALNSTGSNRTGARASAAGDNKVRKDKTTTAAVAPKQLTREERIAQIPGSSVKAPVGGERIDSSELGRNVNNAMNAVVPGPARAFGAAKSAAKSGSRALQGVNKSDTPVTYLGKSGRRQISGFDELSGTGGRPALGSSPLSLRGTPDTKALAAPTRQLGYDKAGAVAKRRSDRSAARDAEMQAENTAATSRAASRQKSEELANELRKGQAKTKFTSKSKGQLKRTKKFDDSEAGVEFKRGGSVNPASKRADGIATRGKTRCKIC